jgi:hypothetical protein
MEEEATMVAGSGTSLQRDVGNTNSVIEGGGGGGSGLRGEQCLLAHYSALSSNY